MAAAHPNLTVQSLCFCFVVDVVVDVHGDNEMTQKTCERPPIDNYVEVVLLSSLSKYLLNIVAPIDLQLPTQFIIDHIVLTQSQKTWNHGRKDYLY